jgi:hypothetical protein
MTKVVIRALGAVVVSALLGGLQAAAQQTQNPRPAAEAAPPAGEQVQAPGQGPAASAPVEEVISLFNAKFSEDFIKRKIKGDGIVFNLTVSDLLRLKEAGIPESLVEAMMATKRAQPAAAPAEGQGGLTPVPAPALVPGQPRSPKDWDGLVRKSSGSVLGIGNRWENGSLHLENDQFRWITAEGTQRNVLVPASSLTEQFLVCEKKPQGDCFEWGGKTKDGEYRFRDILWKTGPSSKVKGIYDYLKIVYPNLASPVYPVDERK